MPWPSEDGAAARVEGGKGESERCNVRSLSTAAAARVARGRCRSEDVTTTGTCQGLAMSPGLDSGSGVDTCLAPG